MVVSIDRQFAFYLVYYLYQLRDKLIEIERLKTMKKVSIKMFENIRKYINCDDEKLTEVALKNFNFYSKENKFANFFNVIANHQVSDDKIEMTRFNILMYHDLSSSSRDIFFNVHNEILKNIMNHEDLDECVEKNIKAENCIFISTQHMYFEKYLKEEEDKMIEFCEIQNAKYSKEQNEYVVSLLRSKEEAHQKARASLRAA